MYCITTKTNKSPSSSFKCIHVFMVSRVCYTKKRNQELLIESHIYTNENVVFSFLFVLLLCVFSSSSSRLMSFLDPSSFSHFLFSHFHHFVPHVCSCVYVSKHPFSTILSKKFYQLLYVFTLLIMIYFKKP